MTRLPPRRMTIAEACGYGPTGQRRQRERELASAAKTVKQPKAPAFPSMPDLDLLTAQDRQRCAQALGVDLPTASGSQVGPQPDALLSRQLAGRYIEDMQRYREHEQQQRNAGIEATIGRLDCTSANAETCRRRLEDLGVADADVLASLRDHGAPLERRPEQLSDERAARQQQLDRDVAQRVFEAQQRGESVDCRRLSRSEFAALMQLRAV